MKTITYFIVIIFLVTSCKSNLSLITPDYLDEVEPNVKTYNYNEFDVYVFNICEKFKNSDHIDRFCNCPENFYDVANDRFLRKVEELYLLRHKNTDLIIYLTTFSHKYISSKENAFLNDSIFYKNNIVLDQLEYAYVGQINERSSIIHFPSNSDERDIILHYDPAEFPKRIFFKKANIATAENNYDISQPIVLDGVFKEDLVYSRKNYRLNYYHSTKNMSNILPKEVDEIKLISQKGKVEVVFGFSNFTREGKKMYYKMAAKRVKYHPNFYLIQ